MGIAKQHDVNIQEPWFTHLLDGEKTIEARPEKLTSNIKAGDVLCMNGIVLYKVAHVKVYESLNHLLGAEGVGAVFPGVSSIREACIEYQRIFAVNANEPVAAIHMHM